MFRLFHGVLLLHENHFVAQLGLGEPDREPCHEGQHDQEGSRRYTVHPVSQVRPRGLRLQLHRHGGQLYQVQVWALPGVTVSITFH